MLVKVFESRHKDWISELGEDFKACRIIVVLYITPKIKIVKEIQHTLFFTTHSVKGQGVILSQLYMVLTV